MSNNWKGKIMIVKDDRCIMILPEELEKYKEEGWKRGSRRKPMSKEHRENISKNTVKAMQNPEILKKLKDKAFRDKSTFLAKRRKSSTDMTTHEEYIKDFMYSLGFEYEPRINMHEYRLANPELHIATYYRPDFANHDLKIAIELDGKSHTSKTKHIDEKKEKALLYYGYKTFRFKNHEIYEDSFKARVLDIISNIKGGDDFNE